MFEEGDQVGAYTIVRRLGAGGMGEVYLGRHRHIGREAAIKVLLPELSKNDDVVARFFTEARATATIRHPGIVEILDCDVHRTGRAYIVMEFLQGENLAERLARAGSYANDLPAAGVILAQAGSAVGAAHAKGIIHRDLKPDNVFLCQVDVGATPIVKILDFGIAKLITDDGQGRNKTRTGSLLGTPTYMSPEQCRGAANIDLRTDVYAVGCMAFEMFAGRPPFVRDGAGEVLVAHLMEKPPSLSSLVGGVPPALDALIGQMLEKDPAARPPTMAEVVSRVEGIFGIRSPTPAIGSVVQPLPSAPIPTQVPTQPSGSVVRAPVIAGGTRVMQVSHTTLSDTASEASDKSGGIDARRRARPRWLIPAIAGGGGLLVIVAVIAALSGPSKPPPSAHRAPPEHEVTRPPPPPPPEPPPPPPPPATVTIEVASDPPGAEVWLPGEDTARGTTPLKIALRRGEPPARVTLRARGFNETTVSLDPAREDTGPINVVMDKLKRDKERKPQGESTGGTGTGTGTRKPRPRANDPYKPMGD